MINLSVSPTEQSISFTNKKAVLYERLFFDSAMIYHYIIWIVTSSGEAPGKAQYST
jgi:hypothetical protein